MSIEGQCMCEAVNVTIDHVPEQMILCHCGNCKRQSGGTGNYNAMVEEKHVKIRGTTKLYMDHKTDSGKPVHRNFCAQCGCPIYSTSETMPGKLIVKMGLFDKIPKAAAEWFCVNKQSWEPSVEGAKLFERSAS